VARLPAERTGSPARISMSMVAVVMLDSVFGILIPMA
jgi:hypothetical protein